MAASIIENAVLKENKAELLNENKNTSTLFCVLLGREWLKLSSYFWATIYCLLTFPVNVLPSIYASVSGMLLDVSLTASCLQYAPLVCQIFLDFLPQYVPEKYPLCLSGSCAIHYKNMEHPTGDKKSLKRMNVSGWYLKRLQN